MNNNRTDSIFDKPVDRKNTDSLKWDKYAGKDIIPLWVADMDFQSPSEVIEALKRRIEHGVFGYTLAGEQTTAAVTKWLADRYSWNIDPDWIVWLPGLVTGLNVMCRAFGNPNDEVITFTPVYPPFLSAPVLQQRKLLTSRLVLDNDRYTFDLDDFKKRITTNTKTLLLCNPHNPTGRAFTKKELEPLANLCLENNIVICSDEIHCDLILDDVQHIPTAAINDSIAQNTVTLMSPAKTFNLPGLSCGFAIIPNEHLHQRYKSAAAGIVPHVNTMGLTACRTAFQKCEYWRKQLIEYLKQNRGLVQNRINNIPGLSMKHTEATYLAWIDITELNLDDPLAYFENTGVGPEDGAIFAGPGFIRLNFATRRALLTEALNRIQSALS